MGMRTVDPKKITGTVKDLCIRANTVLRPDVLEALKELSARQAEGSVSKDMTDILIANAEIAREKKIAICQDTGMVAVFVDIGEDVVISGGNIASAVNKGIEEAYREGSFRKSVVEDPFLRKNTETNTPGVIHIDPVPGDRVTVSVMPKGFGSENKSRMMMFNPTDGPEKIIRFCVDTVRAAGPDACPPYILGVGIGGTMEGCALLAKKALLRPLGKNSEKEHVAGLEKRIREEAEALGIGIMGMGGPGTVIGVNIEAGPTHIAGLPVAVNVSCHALRSATGII